MVGAVNQTALFEMIDQTERKCNLNTNQTIFSKGVEISPEKFECVANVTGDVSKENGLEELWSLSQPQFQLHVDNWQKFENIEGFFDRIQ